MSKLRKKVILLYEANLDVEIGSNELANHIQHKNLPNIAGIPIHYNINHLS